MDFELSGIIKGVLYNKDGTVDYVFDDVKLDEVIAPFENEADTERKLFLSSSKDFEVSFESVDISEDTLYLFGVLCWYDWWNGDKIGGDNMNDIFKVGDKVLLSNQHLHKITTVEKITPKGFIKVDGILFNPNGIERGGDAYGSYHIDPITDEREQELRKEFFVNNTKKKLKKFDFNNTTYEQACKIALLLNELEVTNES